MATEGVVSFPLGMKKICAVGSHFLEFEDTKTGEILAVWKLKTNGLYSVILTTGGGLYRYCLEDIVTVSGRLFRTPLLRFISRKGGVSDHVGEKLYPFHVEQIIREIERHAGMPFPFAMLAPYPDGNRLHYVLYMKQIGNCLPEMILEKLESGLLRNYHYAHARRVGQLAAADLFFITGDAQRVYRDYLITKGMKAGDIKPVPLHSEPVWQNVFSGYRINEHRTSNIQF